MKSKWLTNVIHQLVGGEVVEDIISRGILTNPVRLCLPKHRLVLLLISKEGRRKAHKTESKASCSPAAMATTLFLPLLTSSLLLSLSGC